MVLTACGRWYFSLNEDKEKYSNNPLEVNCKFCLRDHQFGQGNWRARFGHDFQI